MVTYSQSDSEQSKISPTSVGFQVGLTSTDMTGGQIELETDDPEAKYVKGNGLEVAFRIKHEFNPLFYFKSGLGYYQRNGQVEESGIRYATHGPFNFVQIPVLIGIQPFTRTNSNHLNLGIESGFSINSMISSNNNLDKGLHPDNEVEKKSLVPSFHLGVNLEVPLKDNIYIIANYQYCRDLTFYYNRRFPSFNSELERITYTDYDLWFKSQNIGLGFMFALD